MPPPRCSPSRSKPRSRRERPADADRRGGLRRDRRALRRVARQDRRRPARAVGRRADAAPPRGRERARARLWRRRYRTPSSSRSGSASPGSTSRPSRFAGLGRTSPTPTSSSRTSRRPRLRPGRLRRGRGRSTRSTTSRGTCSRGLFGRIRSWLVPEGLFLVSLGTSDNEGWTGEWLGAPTFFSSFPPETNRRLLDEAGFERLLDEVVTFLEPEPDEGEARFQWVLARR